MKEEQISAIKCAYADLQGAKQAHDQMDIHAHDWTAHSLTIREMEDAFPFLENDEEE